jgi:hypothetical protein
MLFQIPDTSGYMIGGYAFAFITMALYLISIILRGRNLRQDLTILENIEEEAQAKEAKSKTAK